MGWWNQNDEGHSLVTEDTGLVWGDGVADIMDSALAAITEEFQRDWNRKPTKDELAAGFRFSLRGQEAETLHSVIELEEDLSIRSVETIVERIREVAFPELVVEGGIPKRIEVEWSGECADDPWELRSRIAELEIDLGAYFGSASFHLDRPRPKGVKTDVADN